ncbi:MAG: NAD-dependent epimerase/dehydratase family protein [Bryobacteraceae bacterium]
MARHPLERDLAYVLEETKDLWEGLRGQSLFVTGGTGFVGTWLVESFVWANRHLHLDAHMAVLSRNPRAFRDKAPQAAADESVTFVQGSLSDLEIPTREYPFVIHAATDQLGAPSQEEPGGTFDRELAGTRRVLELARRAKTRRLLCTSSGAVYGEQPPEIPNVSEDYAGAPDTMDVRSGYGLAKRASEFLCTLHGQQYGFEPVIARLFAFVGPHLPLDRNFAIGNFVRDALRGGPIRISGDGTPIRSYLYAADMAVWLWTLLFMAQPFRPYNVGSDREISVGELARCVVEIGAPAAAVEVAQSPSSGVPPARYVPSIERARKELGLEVKIPLDAAIRRMFDWHRVR